MEYFDQSKLKSSEFVRSAIEYLTMKSGSAEDIKRLTEIQETIEKDTMTVVVCGECKMGKSSLLAAYLEEFTLFPVNVDIATNAATVVSYDIDEKITVIINDNEKTVEKEIVRSEIRDYVTEQGNAENNKDVQLLKIKVNNPHLKGGLVLVDTPGVGGLNFKHNAISSAFLPGADVILYVSEASSPLSKSELNFIRNTYRVCKNIIFILTKTDVTPNYKSVENDNRQKIAETISISPQKVNILPVSSKMKKIYLETNDTLDLESSNFNQMEHVMYSITNERRAEIMLVPALGETVRIIGKYQSDLQLQLKALQEGYTNEFKNIQQQMDVNNKEYQEYLRPNSMWYGRLNEGIRKISRNVTFQFNSKISEIVKLLKQTNTDYSASKVDDTLQELQAELNSIIYENQNELKEQLGDLYSEIRDQVKLDIDDFDISEVNIDVSFDGIDKSALINGVGKSLMVVSQSGVYGTAGATAGSTAGGVIGGILGGLFTGGVGAAGGAAFGSWVGGVIGIAAGGIFGAKQAMTNTKNRNEGEFLKKVMPIIDEVKNKYLHNVDGIIAEMQDFIKNEINQALEEKIARYNDRKQELNDDLNMTKEIAMQKAKFVNEDLNELKKIQSGIMEVVSQMASIIDKIRSNQNRARTEREKS